MSEQGDCYRTGQVDMCVFPKMCCGPCTGHDYPDFLQHSLYCIHILLCHSDLKGHGKICDCKYYCIDGHKGSNVQLLASLYKKYYCITIQKFNEIHRVKQFQVGHILLEFRWTITIQVPTPSIFSDVSTSGELGNQFKTK